MKRNLFRRALACLCLCAVLSGGLCVPARAAGFRDVPAGHWAADVAHQLILKAAAVQALEHHLAQLQKQHFIVVHIVPPLKTFKIHLIG